MSFFSVSQSDSVLSRLWSLVRRLRGQVHELRGRIRGLEAELAEVRERLQRNSGNSSRPPSSDGPDRRRRRSSGEGGRRRGGVVGHKGSGPKLLKADREQNLRPQCCPCGSERLGAPRRFHTHQHVELPEVPLEVTHFHLHSARCLSCGNTVKAEIPEHFRNGCGPRLHALVAELSGIHRNSRRTVQRFLHSFLKLPVSLGGLQRMIDRASVSVAPHYELIGRIARSRKVNHIDETSWPAEGRRHWLWTMAGAQAAFFMLHPHRSNDAFKQLVKEWKGVMGSDDYGLYRSWEHGRQTCLAHLIRTARGFAESSDESRANFGTKVKKLLQDLCGRNGPPSQEWIEEWSKRFHKAINPWLGKTGPPAAFARRLDEELFEMWTFLCVDGMEPTNNRAERALRFAVLWRKMSLGTQSEKGERWIERVASLQETCRLRDRSTFDLFVDALTASFHRCAPDLRWLSNA